MQPILQELSQQLQSLPQQQGESLQQSCSALKEQFLKQLPVIKKNVQALLDGRDRKKVQQARLAVTDVRKQAESLSQPALQLVVDKLLKVEQSLLLADDVLMGTEIHAGLSGAINYAEAAIAASQQAAEARTAAQATSQQDQARRMESRPTPPGRA